MGNIPVDSIELNSHTHDDVDDNSTLSIKIESNLSVAITPSSRRKGLSKPKKTTALQKHPKIPNESKVKTNKKE